MSSRNDSLGPASRDGERIADVVHAEVYLSRAQLAMAAEISPAKLERLIGLGLVEAAAGHERAFTAATAARLRRMVRLHGDLGVNFTGAAIIVDLLERLDRVEAGVMRRRDLHGR